MHDAGAKLDWFEKSVAIVYATIAVLGVFVVIISAFLLLFGADQGVVSLP